MKTRSNRSGGRRIKFAKLAVFAGIGLLASKSVQAAVVYWDTNGGTTGGGVTPSGTWNGTNVLWNTVSSGTPAPTLATPGSTNDGSFSAGTDGTGAYTVTVSGTQSANSLSFANGTGTLTGGTVSLTAATTSGTGVSSGGIFSNTTTAGTSTVASTIQVITSASGSLLKLIANNGSAATDLLISGPITRSSTSNAYQLRLGGSGDGRITSSLGTIVTNMQQGNTAWAGTWTIAGNQTATNLALVHSASATYTAGAKLVLGDNTSDVQSYSAITGNNANVATLVNATATTNAVTVGNGSLEVAGSLSGTTLTIGSSTPTNGTMRVSGSASFSGAFSVAGGTTNKIVGNTATNGTISLTSGTLNSASVTTAVTIGGAGANENNLNLTKINAGTLTLLGTHTYTGTTTVSAGTLSMGATLASPITVSSGATLSGEGTTAGALTFSAGSSTLVFDPATVTGALTGASFSGTGALVTVSPASATTIGTDYTVLKLSGGSFSGSPTTFFVAASRGTLAYTAGNTELHLTPTAAASITWKGNAANPTFWDVANTVNWDNSGPDRFYSNDDVTFNDTATSYAVAVQPASVTAGNIAFNHSSNDYTLSGGDIIGTGSLSKSGTGAVTISNKVTRTAGVTVNGGTLSFGSQTNSIAGGIAVNGGELRFAGTIPNSLSTQPVTLGGGTITYNGTSTIVDNTNLQTFNISTNGSGIRVDTAANVTWRISGKITGGGNWTKSGAGVLSLGQNNSTGPGNDFTGKITVTAGTLDVRHPDSLGTVGGITEVQGATFLIQNFSQSAGTRSYPEPLVFSGTSYLTTLNQQTTAFTNQLTGTIDVSGTLGVSTAITSGATSPILELTGSTLTTNPGSTLALGKLASYPVSTITASQTINIADSITGSGGLTTEGAAGSIYTLTGSNNYTGTTVLNGGTLLVNAANTGGGAYTVNSGTLGGTGSITGAVSLTGSSSTLSPGASIESLDITGATDLASGTLKIEYDGSVSPAIDLLNVVGSLNIASAVLDFDPLGSSLDPTQTYVFANYTSLVGSAFASVIDQPSTHIIDYSYNAGTSIALVPVPEPTLGAMFLAAGLLTVRRRRK